MRMSPWWGLWMESSRLQRMRLTCRLVVLLSTRACCDSECWCHWRWHCAGHTSFTSNLVSDIDNVNDTVIHMFNVISASVTLSMKMASIFATSEQQYRLPLRRKVWLPTLTDCCYKNFENQCQCQWRWPCVFWALLAISLVVSQTVWISLAVS